MTNASAPRAAGKTADARADDPRPLVAMIDGSPFSFDLARCVAFDQEVYPGRWLVGFRLADAGGEPKHWRINGDRGRLAKALDWFASYWAWKKVMQGIQDPCFWTHCLIFGLDQVHSNGWA